MGRSLSPNDMDWMPTGPGVSYEPSTKALQATTTKFIPNCIYPSGNLSMFINDHRAHKKSTARNIAFITFMTDKAFPIVAIVATRDICANEPVLGN